MSLRKFLINFFILSFAFCHSLKCIGDERGSDQLKFSSIEVLSVTKTSVNILYRTPGLFCGTSIRWGRDEQNLNKLYCRGLNPNTSEYEKLHTVSLVNLEPNTEYYYQVGIPLFKNKEGASNKKIYWSKVYRFMTSSKYPEPRQLYVSLFGNDKNSGLSRDLPWKTLSKVCREARAGDTVHIATGKYEEILRPLQTGVSEDKRIVFRGEKPFEVFIDGGDLETHEKGRPHCIQIQSKAFIEVENIVLQRGARFDSGGYREGYGSAGQIRISGSSHIDLKYLVMDGRGHRIPGMVCWMAGLMPGMEEAPYAVKLSDSIEIGCTSVFVGGGPGAIIFEHCLFFTPYIDGPPKWRSMFNLTPEQVLNQNIQLDVRVSNSVFYDVSKTKRYDRGDEIYNLKSLNQCRSDHNAYFWMPGIQKVYTGRVRRKDEGRTIIGLSKWKKYSSQDRHSIERELGPEKEVYPISIQKYQYEWGRYRWKNRGNHTPTLEMNSFINTGLQRKAKSEASLGPRF